MPAATQDGIVTRSIETALAVDATVSKAYVAALRERFPDKTRRELADQMIERARWWGAGFGFVTGVASNPLVTVQATVTDMAALLRTEIVLACRIGLLFDEELLDDDDPPYEVLVPIMGGRIAGELTRTVLASGGMQLTRKALLGFLKTGGVRKLERMLLRRFGLSFSRRGLLTKTVPVVGGLIGGGWNYLELKLVGNRVYKYFESGRMPA